VCTQQQSMGKISQKPTRGTIMASPIFLVTGLQHWA